jgi:hypothetical protein
VPAATGLPTIAPNGTGNELFGVGLREAGLLGRSLDEAASQLVSHSWLITNELNIAQDFEDAAWVERRRGIRCGLTAL